MAFLSDRRKHPRYPINLPVFIFYEEKRASAHTLDVGLEGMKIYTDQGLPSGREILFQLVLKRESIWVKGRLIFRQTDPELMNFSCIHFQGTTKESIFNLQEILSYLQNSLRKEYLDMEVRIRERETALAKANELLEAETERRKRGEQILKEIRDRLGDFSAEYSGYPEEKLKMAVQGLHNNIEAMILAITNGLKNIHIFLKGGGVSDQVSFELIIFSIQNNYKEIQKILDNLHQEE